MPDTPINLTTEERTALYLFIARHKKSCDLFTRPQMEEIQRKLGVAAPRSIVKRRTQPGLL